MNKRKMVQAAFTAMLCLLLSGCGVYVVAMDHPGAAPNLQTSAVIDAESGFRLTVLNPYSSELVEEAAAALQEIGINIDGLALDGAVSRAWFIRLVIGAAEADIPETDRTISGETWYAPYVKAGYNIGAFADHTVDMSFTPTDGFFMGDQGYEDMEKPITRYDAAAIIAHMVMPQGGHTTFADADMISQMPKRLQIDLQTAAGILPPLEDGSFRGDGYISGGQAVVCAWKILTSPKAQPPAVQSVPSLEDTLRQGGRIIHAGGRIAWADGRSYTYTNSAQALVNAYRAGNRVLEFDLLQTADGHIACVHDWLSTISPSITDNVPLSLNGWLEAKVYGRFTPLCLESLAGFMREHPDLYIVTDVKDNNINAAAVIAQTCPDLLDRFVIQIYKDSEYEEVKNLGFSNMIYTLYNLSRNQKMDTEHWIEFAASHALVGYTYPDTWRGDEAYMESMKRTGVMLFVHTINGAEEMQACYDEGFSAVYTDDVADF